MNALEPNVKPDELDALLHAFFRSEMPDPWPQLKAPVTVPASLEEKAPPSWWSRSRSRFALAASVALLMLTCWWLSGRTVDYANPNVQPGVNTADKELREKIFRDQMQKEKNRKTAPTLEH